MSDCGCGSNDYYGDTGAYNSYCNADTPYPSVSHESVPSLIDNLVNALYGAITKDVSSGKVVWNIPCDPANIPATINGIPRNTGEGLLCYIVRALNLTTPSGFVTVNGVQTLTNKTLTSPTINSPTINSPTINSPTINSPTINSPTINSPTINNLTATGTLALPSGSITSTMIANGTILPADLSTGGPTWDTSGNLTATSFVGNVTGNVTGNAGTATTAAKLTTARTIALSGNVTGSVAFDGSANATIAATISAGSVDNAAIANGAVSAAKLGTNEQKQICKAWVNFNGSTAAIRSSYNVSSITRNGTGDYTINFATPMTDANYATLITADNSGDADGFSAVTTQLSTSSRVTTGKRFGINTTDKAGVYVAIFGN